MTLLFSICAWWVRVPFTENVNADVDRDVPALNAGSNFDNHACAPGRLFLSSRDVTNSKPDYL